MVKGQKVKEQKRKSWIGEIIRNLKFAVLESSSKKSQMTQYYMSNPPLMIGHSKWRSPREVVTYSENTGEHTKNRLITGKSNPENKLNKGD